MPSLQSTRNACINDNSTADKIHCFQCTLPTPHTHHTHHTPHHIPNTHNINHTHQTPHTTLHTHHTTHDITHYIHTTHTAHTQRTAKSVWYTVTLPTAQRVCPTASLVLCKATTNSLNSVRAGHRATMYNSTQSTGPVQNNWGHASTQPKVRVHPSSTHAARCSGNEHPTLLFQDYIASSQLFNVSLQRVKHNSSHTRGCCSRTDQH